MRQLSRATLVMVTLLTIFAANVLVYHDAGYRPWAHAAGASVGSLTQLMTVAAIAWWGARRVLLPPVGGASWPGAIARHAALAVVAAFSGALVGRLGAWFAHGSELPATHPQSSFALILAWNAMLYVAIAALRHLVTAAERLRAQQEAATRAQLLALQSQLQPHFLFNALHSATVLAREEPRAVEEVLGNLAGLLRYAIGAAQSADRRVRRVLDAGPATTGTTGEHAASGLVPLAEELAFVRAYVALERLRFGDRLRVEEAVDDAALSARVPPLLLQPLVENAIRHAVAPRREGARLVLSARLHEDDLHVDVEDDGPGQLPEAAPRDGAVGLDVVRRQLAAWYDGRAALEVETSPGAGFSARVRLPAGSDRDAGSRRGRRAGDLVGAGASA